MKMFVGFNNGGYFLSRNKGMQILVGQDGLTPT